MAIGGRASTPFRRTERPRGTAAKRPSPGRRPRHRGQHDSEIHRQRSYHPLLHMDIAAGTAAAMGANPSGAVRLKGGPCVSLTAFLRPPTSKPSAQAAAKPVGLSPCPRGAADKERIQKER